MIQELKIIDDEVILDFSLFRFRVVVVVVDDDDDDDDNDDDDEIKHIRPLVPRYSDFKNSYKDWAKSDTIEEFETKWEDIRDKYNLESNSELIEMYYQ